MAGCSLFPSEVEPLLAILNSRFAAYVLKLINPTVNFQVGDIDRVPLPPSFGAALRDLARRAVDIAGLDAKEDEATYDFIAPPVWPDGAEGVTARHRDLAALENEVDEEVYRLYDISPDDRRVIEEELASATISDDEAEESEGNGSEEAAEPEGASLTTEELAQRWVSYAVGIALGRFPRPGLAQFVDADGVMVVQRDHPDDLAARVIAILAAIHGDAEAGRIVRAAIGGNGEMRDALAGYLLGPFFKAHAKRYRKRPVYWLLQSPKQRFGVYLFHERATDQTLALLQGARYLGGRIFQLKQQLEDANRQETAAEGREKAKWRKHAQDLAEELADLEAFDQAITATNSEPILDFEGKTVTARWVPEFDDGVLLNAAPLYRLTPAWKRADAKLDLSKAWKTLKDGEYPWAKTAMRYWPRETLKACKDNKSYRIAHGLE
jgi:DNA-binding transcriptional MerR regulator